MEELIIPPGFRGLADQSGCILFTGYRNEKGYGLTWRKVEGKQRKFRVHRLVLEHKLCRPIRSGYCACHACDTRACINPEHLWEGTVRDNNYDSLRKRYPGFLGSLPLSDQDIEVIKYLHKNRSAGYRLLSMIFNVDRDYIRLVLGKH